MAAFEYTALDAKGKNRRGVLEGDTARQVRQQLRDSGWTPLSIEEVSQRETETRKGGGGARRFQRGISSMDLALVTRQLATLVRSGLPIEQVLQSVAQQSEKRRLKRILLAVRSRVREGHSLHMGLSDFPGVFPDLYRRTVEAGEQSGHLDVVLERLAEYTENRQKVKQKTMLALLYPITLTVMAVLVVVGLLTYVVPEVVKVFENMDERLPPLTEALVSISGFLRESGLLLVVLIVGAVFLFSYMMNRPSFKRSVHRLTLRLPIIGRLTRGNDTARFARTLSILTDSNVPILESLRIAGQVLSNLPMRDAVEEAAQRVREGSSLHAALEATGYFPPMTISLISSGEASGELEAMLDRAANIQEREVEGLMATFLGLFEPILILVMGVVVLVIVLAILLPIFNLNQLVS